MASPVQEKENLLELSSRISGISHELTLKISCELKRISQTRKGQKTPTFHVIQLILAHEPLSLSKNAEL